MNDIKLTENQEALLARIDLIAEGAWFDEVVTQAFEQEVIKTKLQAKATLNQLIKKGILAVDTTKEEGSSWVTLTDLGGDVIGGVITDLGIAAEEVLDGLADEEEDEDLLGDVTEEEVRVGRVILEQVAAAEEEEEEEDLLGDTGEIDLVVKEQVVSHTENYTVNEWVDTEDTEWTETLFADGSRTLKRRRLVSNAWRTDYWGAEFSGDSERATTAKLAKLARANGHFTHTPHEV